MMWVGKKVIRILWAFTRLIRKPYTKPYTIVAKPGLSGIFPDLEPNRWHMYLCDVDSRIALGKRAGAMPKDDTMCWPGGMVFRLTVPAPTDLHWQTSTIAQPRLMAVGL